MMEANPDTIAIIVAAGRGNRFGSQLPKQFCDLSDRPMLMTTIDRFTEAIGLGNILLVIDPTMEKLWNSLCDQHAFMSPQIVYGGDSRWQSVKNAVDSINGKGDTVVMIHDGARPLITADFIKSMAILPDNADGLIPATAPVESLRYIDNDNGDSHAVDRSRYIAVQTPQVFRLSTLRDSYGRPFRKEFTDDASVVESAGYHAIRLADGLPTNIKITNPLDIAIAEAIINAQKKEEGK